VSEKPDTSRRNFVKLCASAVAGVTASPHVLARHETAPRPYDRVRLVDAWGETVRAADLKAGENYLFHYPFVATPCFLLNLGKPVVDSCELTTAGGDRYRWNGGVGPGRSVVAFSAICAHKMTHPARSVSFINYRHEDVNFTNSNAQSSRRGQVIYCCSERSVYDPALGAQVLGGPAPQPLATVLLDYDHAEDAFYATGTHGGEMFDRYFEKFEHRLILEYATDHVRNLVSGTSRVMPLTDYCRTRVLCG
jgi:arsenite oxidase small subunit